MGELGYPTPAHEIERRLDLLLPDPCHFISVSDEGIGIAGWVAVERRITLESGIKFEIVSLVVDSRHRRTGIARSLIQEAEAWVRANGGSEIVVRSNVIRQESHPMYHSLGYNLAKTQHVYGKHV
ncbi:MAG: GNAT family N-acetyltransferase [Proteobacteria bacterium]|nr:GNAT family N-acetyltransferase [Pseudomonadota bacterium]